MTPSDAKKRIDNYIASGSALARPILRKLRELIFIAEPAIIEDWKWGPNYSKNGMVCGYFGFKEHVTFTFFGGAALKDPK
jgi:hypothetical protein